LDKKWKMGSAGEGWQESGLANRLIAWGENIMQRENWASWSQLEIELHG
jgi:hypothetical protein